MAQSSGHIKPSNTGGGRVREEGNEGSHVPGRDIILHSLVQDQMAKVKRVELGKARGLVDATLWRGKLSHCLSTETLLQPLSSVISRKVISLLAPGANSSRQEGILWR